MRVNLFLLTILVLVANFSSNGQDFRWQQRVDYKMNVKLDVKTHKVTGVQQLQYFNNSPDTLSVVYYHLYFNAFQPGSMMDVRSQQLPDPDRRIMDRISKLGANEIGYQKILSLQQDGKEVTHQINGTVMEVELSRPLLPRTSAIFNMEFESQVPVQIRRSGRDNAEGIAYSMTQWYPKMAEYDFQGWHAYPYVAREFQSVWGDFDVTIRIDRRYVVAGTGKLQNPEAVGFGYERPGTKVQQPSGDITWHFIAKNVIDFAWAADPDYAHDILKATNGPEVHFFYQKKDPTIETWKKMEPFAIRTFEYFNEHFGKYPFETYSIIQGGDGGMEYPMCTLILGEGTLSGVVGTMAHEVAHSWYQMALASNEALYAWMDEGFAQYTCNELLSTFATNENVHAAGYSNYFSLVASGLQEPASEHADHFNTNRAYSITAYFVGEVFLNQLKYIIGDDNFNKGMKLYYNTWKMHHPEPNDFIRVMEKVSGLQLHWYLRYWINTTKRIDYGIKSVADEQSKTSVVLERLGELPMPIDLMVNYRDGSRELVYLPMNEMMGRKPPEDRQLKRLELDTWPWVNPTYSFILSKPMTEIVSMEIDPSQRMADINRKNNKWTSGDKASPR